MSTSTTTAPPLAEATTARRIADYRARVELIRRRYHRRARCYTCCANGVSLSLVAAGAGIGVTALVPHSNIWTVGIGALVVLLEGVTRVLRPALRAGRARRTTAALDREFRLFDAGCGHYHGGPEEAESTFVGAVERILARAGAEEEREDGSASAPADPAGRRRGLRSAR